MKGPEAAGGRSQADQKHEVGDHSCGTTRRSLQRS